MTSSDDTNSSLGASLRPSIDFASVQYLNESRLYENRLTSIPSLLSQHDPDDVPELLLIVTFSEVVSMKSICSLCSDNVLSTTATTAPPRTVRIYVNRPNHGSGFRPHGNNYSRTTTSSITEEYRKYHRLPTLIFCQTGAVTVKRFINIVVDARHMHLPLTMSVSFIFTTIIS